MHNLETVKLESTEIVEISFFCKYLLIHVIKWWLLKSLHTSLIKGILSFVQSILSWVFLRDLGFLCVTLNLSVCESNAVTCRNRILQDSAWKLWVTHLIFFYTVQSLIITYSLICTTNFVSGIENISLTFYVKPWVYQYVKLMLLFVETWFARFSMEIMGNTLNSIL